jgi:hypothetical protein
MSFQHVQDAILGILVVIATGCRVPEVLTHVVQDICGHRESEIPPLVHFYKVLRKLDGLIVIVGAHLLFGFSLIFFLLLLSLLVLR